MGGQRVAPLCAASILSVACKLLEGRRFPLPRLVSFLQDPRLIYLYKAEAAASSGPRTPLYCLYCLYSIVVFGEEPILLYAAYVCGLFFG